MRLALSTHGQSLDWPLENLLGARSDPRLDESGVRQAHSLHTSLATVKNAYPEGETIQGAIARAIQALETLDAESEGLAVVVSHDVILRLVIGYATSIPRQISSFD